MNTKQLPAIVLTGLLAGTLDIVAACTLAHLSAGVSPLRVLQYIASGVFGATAFAHDYMAVLGLLFHYGIATAWAALFFVLYPRLALLRSSLWVGLGYGLVIWALMNFALLPLSQVAARPFSGTAALAGASIVMLCIGLPIAWRARTYYAQP